MYLVILDGYKNLFTDDKKLKERFFKFYILLFIDNIVFIISVHSYKYKFLVLFLENFFYDMEHFSFLFM